MPPLHAGRVLTECRATPMFPRHSSSWNFPFPVHCYDRFPLLCRLQFKRNIEISEFPEFHVKLDDLEKMATTRGLLGKYVTSEQIAAAFEQRQQRQVWTLGRRINYHYTTFVDNTCGMINVYHIQQLCPCRFLDIPCIV